MTPRQCRMARAALDWQRHDLANRAGSTASMITKIETDAYVKPSIVEAVERVFAARGVVFGEYDSVAVRLDAVPPCPRVMAVPQLDRPGGPAAAATGAAAPPLSVVAKAG